MNKKGFRWLRVTCFIFILGLVLTAPIMAAEVNWKFFTYFPTNDTASNAFRDFADDIFKSSNGRFQIKVFTSGE